MHSNRKQRRSQRAAKAKANARPKPWEAVRIPYSSRRVLKPLSRGLRGMPTPPRAGWLALFTGPPHTPARPVFVDTADQAAAALTAAYRAWIEQAAAPIPRVVVGDADLAEALLPAHPSSSPIRHAARLPRSRDQLEGLHMHRLLRTEAAIARLGPRFPEGVGFDPALQYPAKMEGGFADPMMAD